MTDDMGEPTWMTQLRLNLWKPGLAVFITGHSIPGKDGTCTGCGRYWKEIQTTAQRSRINQPCHNPGRQQ